MSGGYVLDTGALIAIERGDERVRWLTELRGRRAVPGVAVPTGVIAQVWRSGTGRQAHLARFLKLPAVQQVGLSPPEARLVGEILAATGTSDVIDAWVVLCARVRGQAVVTSDPDDLQRLDPSAEIVVV